MYDFNGLTDIDFKILAFIKKNNSIHLEKILKKFPDKKYTTKYRLTLLSTYNFNDSPLIKEILIDKNEDNIWDIGESTNIFVITEKGLKVLSDYNNYSNSTKAKEIKTSFIYPILSATVTAIIVSYITNYFILK